MANVRAWLINNAQFPFVDPETQTRFEPGTPIKAELTDFVKMQQTIVRCANPDDELSPKEQEKLQQQIEADEAERVKREEAAERARAEANGQVIEQPAAAVIADEVDVSVNTGAKGKGAA